MNIITLQYENMINLKVLLYYYGIMILEKKIIRTYSDFDVCLFLRRYYPIKCMGKSDGIACLIMTNKMLTVGELNVKKNNL